MEYKGEAVAKRFIFMPEEDIEGTDYVLSLLPAIRSYAGVPMKPAGNGARHVVPVSATAPLGLPEPEPKGVKKDCGCR